MLNYKIKIILVLFLFIITNNAFSQNETKSDQSSNLYLHVEGGEKKEQPKSVEQIIAEYNLEQVNSMIKAFELKKEHIANDPNQNSLAKENGWYDRINYELTLLHKRKEIITSANKK